ncbi:MAG: ABC transporter permease [Anaerolineales bacterium]
MLKILLIGLKDLTLAFRDRAALILMLLAPFVLTLGLGFVTGRFSGDTGSGLSEIPVVLVNADGDQMGNALADLFASEDLAELIAPTTLTDATEARQQVLDDEVAAAVIIPAGFTDSVFARSTDNVKVEVHANPARPLSAGVVQAIVEEFLSRVRARSVTGRVTIEQLIRSGRLQPQEAQAAAEEFAQRQTTDTAGAITLTREVAGADAQPEFDVLAYLAPAMALMFLMYTVGRGGATLLAERTGGTLSRLLTSPTSAAQVLGGKVFGIFLTGAAQVGILILATTLMFGVRWGDWVGVVALVLASAIGATGWGMLLAAFSKSPAQVGSVGSALMLIFAILGGSFGPNVPLPDWVAWIASLTPNKWGIDGFASLGSGNTLADIVPNLVALLVMGALLFAVAVFVFRRQGLTQK